MTKTKAVQATAIGLMVLTVLSKVLGFGRELVLSYTYGVSATTDALVVAMGIPVSMIAIISNGITTSYIPMYSSIAENEGKPSAERFTSNLVNVVLVIATLIVIIGEIFTPQIVRLFALGYEGEKLRMTVEMTRWSILSIYAISVMSVMSGYLYLHDEFNAPMSIGFVLNVIIISVILLSRTLGTRILGLGIFLANTLQYTVCIPAFKRTGYRHQKVLDIRNPYLKEMIKVAFPVMVGVAVMEINNLADKTFSSLLGDGALAALSYGQRLIGFVSGIVIMSITTSAYPGMSRAAAQEDMEGLKEATTTAIGMANLLVFPAAVGLMALARPITEFLYLRGEMTPEGITMITSAMFFYAPMLMGQAGRDVLSRAFYATKNMRTPMIISSMMVVINVVLDYLLMQIMGIGGLALATTIATIFGMVMMFMAFRKQVGSFGFAALLVGYVKVLSASVLMGLAVHFVHDFLILRTSALVALAGSIAIAAFVYAILALIFKIEGIWALVEMFGDKVKKK